MQKTPLEIHRDLIESGIFNQATQAEIASSIGVNQGTISRIENGNFRRINKSVQAICKYAKINTVRTAEAKQLRSLVSSSGLVNDPDKRKLVDIIGLAVDLLERS